MLKIHSFFISGHCPTLNTVRNGCRTCFPSLDVFAHRVKADQFAFAHLDEREVVFLKPRS